MKWKQSQPGLLLVMLYDEQVPAKWICTSQSTARGMHKINTEQIQFFNCLPAQEALQPVPTLGCVVTCVMYTGQKVSSSHTHNG